MKRGYTMDLGIGVVYVGWEDYLVCNQIEN